MSKTRTFTKPARNAQQGAALLEALIGMLILSIALMGSLLTLAHGMRTQHTNGVRAQVIEQLRSELLSKGAALCGTTVLLVGNTKELSASVTCEPYTNVSVALPGKAAVPIAVAPTEAQRMTALVDSPLLGGVLTVTSTR